MNASHGTVTRYGGLCARLDHLLVLSGAIYVVYLVHLVLTRSRLKNATLAKSSASSAAIHPAAKQQAEHKETVETSTFLGVSPTADFSLDTVTIGSRKTRDHVYANKTIRYPYHQTMAHQPMLADHWLEPDHNYLHDLDYKRDLIERQGKVVVDVMHHPTAVEGCGELLQEVADWLVSRFPNAFIWTEKDKVVLNTLTAEPVRLVDQGGAFKTGVEALKTISRLVQDDFLLALPSNAPAHPSADSQEWLCVGGLVAFPGFYLLSEKIGRTLHATHAPVPGFNEKLLKSVQRSLTRLSPSTPIERTSWELVDSEDLFWAPLAGPLPTCSGAKPFLPHHYQGRTDASAEALDPADMILRLDHQTFVKLPKSGMVAFGIHPMRRRLADLKQQPLLPNLLIKVHQESDRELMRYKAAPLYQDRVLPYLQSLHQHQVDSGLIRGDERVQDFRLYA